MIRFQQEEIEKKKKYRNNPPKYCEIRRSKESISERGPKKFTKMSLLRSKEGFPDWAN